MMPPTTKDMVRAKGIITSHRRIKPKAWKLYSKAAKKTSTQEQQICGQTALQIYGVELYENKLFHQATKHLQVYKNNRYNFDLRGIGCVVSRCNTQHVTSRLAGGIAATTIQQLTRYVVRSNNKKWPNKMYEAQIPRDTNFSQNKRSYAFGLDNVLPTVHSYLCGYKKLARCISYRIQMVQPL